MNNPHETSMSQMNRLWKKRTLSLLTFAFVIFYAIFYHLLSPSTEPKLSCGGEPEEVIETFYRSINTLDFQAMENCTIEEAGQTIIREVTQMHVMSKMRKAYSPNAPLIIADQWEQAGRPDLQVNQYLYGIAHLKIEEVSSSSQSIFIVTYDKWNPAGKKSAPTTQPLIQNRMSRITERVRLTRNDQSWVIFNIERLSPDPE